MDPQRPHIPTLDGPGRGSLSVSAEQMARWECADEALAALESGVAVLDAGLRVQLANPALVALCARPPLGLPFAEALGEAEFLGPDLDPFAAAREGRPATTRVCHRARGHYLDLRVTFLPASEGGEGPRFVVVCREVTQAVLRQQKLDSLHQAGQELADLAPDQLAEMSVPERAELLKLDLRRSIHDVLHYDVMEVRLLDRATGRLEPLLAEGMTPEAEQRELYARPTGNGVTGLVAATGKGYLCSDTAADPHYIEGAAGARSSLTVPLLVQDQVIGTLNVESPYPNAFTPEDLQFAELFSREVARSLHTLELLTAQETTTATRSVEAVMREVALPLDELLASAADLLARSAGDPAELAEPLRRAIDAVRCVKQSVRKVGDDLATVPADAGGRPPAGVKGMRVLVADSEERTRRSAHLLLDRLGCQVETVGSGRLTVLLARSGCYDAILVDIRLPDLTGLEVYRQLRQARPAARVALTTAFGYDPSHTLVRARQEGLRYTLFKPFRLDQLLECLLQAEPAPCQV